LVFGKKKDDKNHKLREQLEHGGGQRAWAVVLECKFSYSTGGGAGYTPKNLTEHYKLTLRVQPENYAPFEATVRATGTGGRRTGDSIGVIFDPGNHSKLAVYPEWAFASWEADKPRVQEAIAAFLAR
jgi:hypothetical protein